MAYSKKVIEYFSSPKNAGEIDNADGIGTAGGGKCGDIMKLYITVDNGIITDARFKTFGSGAAIASSSMAAELIVGKTPEEALAVTNKDVVTALDGLPEDKLHCSLLAERGIRAAVEDYLNRKK